MGSKFKNIEGKVYGKLKVIKNVGKDIHGRYLWKCLCQCGNYKNIMIGDLNSGRVKSCGKCNTYIELNDYMICKDVKGLEFKFDKEDYNLIKDFTWNIAGQKKKYVVTHEKDSVHKLRLHVFLMSPPKGYIVDHINGDTLDNRKQNLRICTIQENNFNSSKKSGANKYKGVYFYPKTNKYVTFIQYNKKQKNLGYYLTENDAARAYNKKAIELFGEYAKLNIIDEGDK